VGGEGRIETGERVRGKKEHKTERAFEEIKGERHPLEKDVRSKRGKKAVEKATGKALGSDGVNEVKQRTREPTTLDLETA